MKLKDILKTDTDNTGWLKTFKKLGADREMLQYVNNNISKGGGESGLPFEYVELDMNNASANIEVLQTLELENSHPAIVYLNNKTSKYVGDLYAGKFICFVSGRGIAIFDVNYRSGEITEDKMVSVLNISQEAYLIHGATNGSEEAALNLEQLQMISALIGSTFNIRTDFGVGVATFNNGAGGEAVIENAYGHKIFYTIGIDGSFTKVKETGYEYTDHGLIDADFEIPYDNSNPFVEYAGEFEFGDTVYNVTFPSYVKLPTTAITEYQANHTYQYSILNNKCVIVEFAN